MSIEIQEILGGKQKRLFIHLPARIHKGHSNWVPPIYMDERTYFNPKKNKSFNYADTILLLAYKNARPVGRIMGIINNRYNESHGESHARFSYLECWDDPEVATALLRAVEEWAGKKGMVKLVGPLGFSDKDPQGLLIEGFDEPIVISTNCNFPYLPEFLEKNGFKKEVDLVVYKVDIPDQVPEIYQRIHDRVLSRNNLLIREFTSKKEMRPMIRPVLQLMNDTFQDIYGYDDMTDKEMDELASRYLPVLNPEFIKVVENDLQEPVAFLIGMPDISDGIRKSRGYLFPFGIFRIIRAGKRTKQLNLLLGGIREDHRNHGLDAVMGTRIIVSAHKAGLEYVDSHVELETNTKVRSEMERMGGKVYKRYRIFQKPIRI